MRFYHGTHTESAATLGGGEPLDEQAAAERHIDGEPGFYLATELGDAEFFAVRRSIGWVVPYELSPYAVSELLRHGALRRPIPGRPPPLFAGEELFVPVALFSLFNSLLEKGEIYVA